MLYVAWKRVPPWKFARFVLLKSVLFNLLCVFNLILVFDKYLINRQVDFGFNFDILHHVNGFNRGKVDFDLNSTTLIVFTMIFDLSVPQLIYLPQIDDII